MFQEINSIFSKHILTVLHLKSVLKSPCSHQKNEQNEKVLENDL